jgi:hypothetical protein
MWEKPIRREMRECGAAAQIKFGGLWIIDAK